MKETPPSLEALVAKGLIAPAIVDQDRISRWVGAAEEDLALARELLAKGDTEHATEMGYAAGFKICLGVLNTAGYRVRDQPGHHVAALTAAGLILGPTAEPLLDDLDDARKFRNRRLYDVVLPPGAVQVEHLLASVQELNTTLRHLRP